MKTQAAGSQKNILEKIYLSFLLQASSLGGDQLWWLLKKVWLFLPACRTPGRKERQYVPQGYQHHTPSSTLHNMGDPSRGPPRLGINTGTILTKLNAAEEAPGNRLGSLPGLPCTSAEYHPLLRALGRGLQMGTETPSILFLSKETLPSCQTMHQHRLLLDFSLTTLASTLLPIRKHWR